MASAASSINTIIPNSILIVDDHPVVRRGLASLIETDCGLSIAAEASTRREALEAIELHSPDLVLVDLSLGQTDGLDLIEDMKVRFPALPALVVSMHDEMVYGERSLKAGAKGYVNKQQLDETVLIAIHCVLSGKTYMGTELEQKLAAKYVANISTHNDGSIDSLSNRELQVFRMIGQGQGTRTIADQLNLSIKTIESHRDNIKRKLSIIKGPELIRTAVYWVETGKLI